MRDLGTEQAPLRPLGEVSKIETSKHDGSPATYVGLEGISNDTGAFIGDFQPVSVKSATFSFSDCHVLYGRLRPYLNKALVPDFSGHCSTEIFPLRPGPELDRKYLFYWLTSEATKNRINATSTGARMPRANMHEVMRFELPIPQLEEQRRIVAVLDEAFEGLDRARAHAEANLQNARELLARSAGALFNAVSECPETKILTVEELAISEKGSIRTGPFGSQLLHSEFVDEGVAVLGIDNAVANTFRWGKRRFITPAKYAELKRYTVKPDDVIITIMGTCGRCAVIPNDIPIAINTKHLCCISLDQTKCLPSYLHRYFLLSPRARDYLSSQASGSVMDGLNMGIIKSMPVEVPSIVRQEDLALRIDEIEQATSRAAKAYEKNLTDIVDLRQSLLQRAFSGQLK